MVIDFLSYVETKRAQEAAVVAAAADEVARKARLEWVLADLLADLEAA